MKIITETHDNKNFIKLLRNKYKYFKVVVLAYFEQVEKYSNIIDLIKQEVKDVCILTFSECVNNSNLIFPLVKEALTEDVGVIVNFCDEDVVNAVNVVRGKIALITYLTEPNWCVMIPDADYLIVNQSLINKCSTRSIIGCYGKMCSLLFCLVEQAFNSSVLEMAVSGNSLMKIEECMTSLTLITPSILKSEIGKKLLTNTALKVKDFNDGFNHQNSFVFKLSNLVVCINKHKTLTKGEGVMIASVLAFKMFNVLLSSNCLSGTISFNAYERMKNTKQFLKQFSLSEISKSFMCDNNLENHIVNLMKIKDLFKNVFDLYYGMFSKMLKVFTNTYLDKGVSLIKYLSQQILLKAVNLLPEQYSNVSLATFIRDCGLLNKF